MHPQFLNLCRKVYPEVSKTNLVLLQDKLKAEFAPHGSAGTSFVQLTEQGDLTCKSNKDLFVYSLCYVHC